MKLAALSRIALCIIGISCSSAPIVSAAQSCKCPRNPGPGGGVQCAANQIATCDPSSGECNCTCDSAQPGKTKADYEAQIFSKVLHTKVEPDDLSSPQYQKFISTFRKSDGDKGTFKFDKETGGSQGKQIQVGVPGWLEEVLGTKAGVSIGPGALLQNCPNGNCTGRDNNGTTINATTNAPNSAVSVGQQGGITAGTVRIESPKCRWKSLTDADYIGMANQVSAIPAKLHMSISSTSDDAAQLGGYIAGALAQYGHWDISDTETAVSSAWPTMPGLTMIVRDKGVFDQINKPAARLRTAIESHLHLQVKIQETNSPSGGDDFRLLVGACESPPA